MFEPDRLGLALRQLRASRNLKQRQVARGAEITPSMLSGYENGRKQPTISTLEKILSAMDYGLGDLAQALRSPPGLAGTAPRMPSPRPTSLCPDLRAIFECDEPLSREEELAFGEMLRGYCRWLRLLRTAHRKTPQGGAGARR